MSRVFSTRKNQITQAYKKGVHDGIDLVGYSYALDYIVAHSAGTVVEARNNYKTNDTTGSSYGNYVKIKHDNGMYTLYAHLKYMSVPVVKGEKVQKGQIIGYMGNTGHSFGAHLHFEVRDTKDVRIDPTPYIDADLPNNEPKPEPKKSNEEIADEVIAGLWGVGQDRKNRLTEAGYDYDAVQDIVNQKMLGTKSLDDIAYAVIRGEYGVYPERKKKLEAEGYNYSEVQARVNELMS